ncbi:MAG: Fe-S cluster assembly ATPase SufC [Alphaproteobacteria bacterium]|nr:Fe-S cluster assembly ATPase SufC [Alphaproteobacteria bacterium]
MLEIHDFQVSVQDQPILRGIDLNVPDGEVHAIMGPNGSGKSTLCYALSGRDGYEVFAGSAMLGEVDLLELEPEDRASAGLFLAFQYPIEVPGVTMTTFLREALNAQRRYRGEEPVAPMEFVQLMRQAAGTIGLNPEMLKRQVNVGFSGGEKKRNEMLQMAVLKPSLVVMDETDSGLDIDALKEVSHGVNRLRDQGRSFLLITHYQRLLDYITPDRVHVLAGGRIVDSGDASLALTLEANGYTDYQLSAA